MARSADARLGAARRLRRAPAAVSRRETPAERGEGRRLAGAVTRRILDRLNREMPPATAEILDRETRDFLADVELFLEAEAETSGSEPVGFEVSFGRPLDGDPEELAREEPVEFVLGPGLTFRIAGRVDRIDRVRPSEFRVIDYKTGGYWRDDWKGTFNGGRRLQHALYGLAALELLKVKVHEGEGRPAPCTTSRPTRGDANGSAIAAPSREQVGKSARGPARSDRLGGLRPCGGREGLQVVRLHGRVRRRHSRAIGCQSWPTRGSSRSEGWVRMSKPRAPQPATKSAALKDDQFRRAIREDLQTNLLVEAGAGSGKTQMLAERMAAGVATGVYQIEHMAAVTFTRKAASELRGRFHLALEKRLGEIKRSAECEGRTRESDAQRLESALGNLERFFAGHHPFVLRSSAARTACRIGRVARLHRARRSAGRGASQPRLARLHHQRPSRRRSRHAGPARHRRPAEGSGLRVRDDLSERGCRVPAG